MRGKKHKGKAQSGKRQADSAQSENSLFGNVLQGNVLPGRALTYWRVQLLLLCIAPAVVGGFFFFTAAKLFTLWTFVWVSLFLLLCFVYCPMHYHFYRYSVSERMVRVSRGVVYNRMDAVYIRNLQYTTLSQTPLQKLMRLATLRLYAAGGVVRIPCLNYEEARLLRVQLGKKMEVENGTGNDH